MQLKEYLKVSHRSIIGLSIDLEMSYITAQRIVNGKTDTSLSTAMKIKDWTNGKVKPEDLYKNWLSKQKLSQSDNKKSNAKKD